MADRHPQWMTSAAGRIGVAADDYAAALARGERYCASCKKTLPLDDRFFAATGKGLLGRKSRCRDCISTEKKAHYRATRPQQRAKQLRYQQENREKLYAYNAVWHRRRNAALRAEMIQAYGGRCACCGESEVVFLDLDHIHNDGAAHRRELGNGTQVLLALQRDGWPTDRFQLLCCNCNQGKARNGGVCPHQVEADHGR